MATWETEGRPVLQTMEQLKLGAQRSAGRNDGRCYLLLLEERLLNDLVLDVESAYLDMERVANHIESGRYKVGSTDTDLYRVIVH